VPESERGKFFVREATGLTRDISGRDALIGNVMSMGIGFVFVYEFFATLLYPGVNLPLTVAFALIPGFIISFVYYLFTVSMPRTGGDFVWVSRVVHPGVGFVGNFYITFTLLTVVGTVAGWIPVYGLGPLFAGLGVINSDTRMVNLATTVSAPPWSFVISVVMLSLFIIPLFFSVKSTYRLLWILFAIAGVGTLVMVSAYFSAPTSTFTSNFNRLSGMNYGNTLAKAGLSRGFSLGMTLTGSVFTILNFIGFNFSAYYTGEVRQVKRAQVIAMVGSVLVFALFMALVYTSAYYSAGPDFLNAASSLAGTGNSTLYSMPSPPVLNFLVAFASPSPIVVFLTGLGFLATCVAEITVLSFIAVRNFFAWSFDRVMPSWLVKLDSRRGSPYLAVIAAWILGIVFAALFIYTIFLQFLVYSVINAFATFALASIAAIWFPFRRKDVFGNSPDIVKKKVGGVPVITILGIAGLVVSAFLIYSTIQPGVTPPPTGPILVKALAYSFVPLTGIIALVIYVIAYYYRRSQGIDMTMAFREIPPE
jgi:amino acid transporter